MSEFIKIYFWLKLKDTFFTNPKIKKLRRIADGDTFTIIYLKLMLLSLKNNGLIELDGLEPTIEEELALVVDEEVDNIRITLGYLSQAKLIDDVTQSSLYMVDVPTLTGKETDSAERVRRHRAVKALQCNTAVTSRNKSVMPEIKLEKEIDRRKVLKVLTTQDTQKSSVKFTQFREQLKNLHKAFMINDNLSNAIVAGSRVFVDDNGFLQSLDTGKELEKADAQLTWDYLFKNRQKILAN